MGYVYGNAHLSDDEARRTLGEAAGALEDVQVAALSSGRRVNPWVGNCVAIGASAVQLEPLAAADLQCAALGIATLIELFPLTAPSAIDAAEYNRVMAEHADGLRDFTLAHYHVGAPRPGEFWSRLRAEPLPDRLAHKLDLYFANARIQIDQSRLLVLHAAHLMDTVGNKAAAKNIAMIKVAIPAMACQVLDWAIQAHGGGGVCDDFPLAAGYAHARTLRLVDGPDEVHSNQIGRLELAQQLASA